MPKATQLPLFTELTHAIPDEENRVISVILTDQDNQHFAIPLTSQVAAELISVLLEQTPQPIDEPESSVAGLSRIRTGFDEKGNPLLGLFFRNSLPVSVHLTHETISLLKQSLVDLELKMGMSDDPAH